LVLCSLFALWSWFRPYEWNADPAAGCRVVGVQITRDQSYFWLEAHLEVLPENHHDLTKPVSLTTASGSRLEPADTTFGSENGEGTTDIWLKFWLEPKDLAGPVTLHLNDGSLSIKKGNRVPGKSRYFVSNHW
jgi:hypothetical protein